jgi:hypothetical protein
VGLPDVVYLLRNGDQNEELRYSLRSLTNLPHRRVWLAGFQPSWTTNVERIPVRQRHGKWDNQQNNLLAACTHPDLSERFVLFNDDFFVVHPILAVPVLHRGPFSSIVDRYRTRGDEYGRRMRATVDLLGLDALAYDAIHVPMTFGKTELGGMLDDLPDGLLFRSVYGNRLAVGGVKHRDVKSRHRIGDGPFASTSDGAFKRRPAGKALRAMFPSPSPYEVPHAKKGQNPSAVKERTEPSGRRHGSVS